MKHFELGTECKYQCVLTGVKRISVALLFNCEIRSQVFIKLKDKIVSETLTPELWSTNITRYTLINSLVNFLFFLESVLQL